MSIKILKPGVLTTIQDAGRFGYRGIGIGSGGAMDLFAMKVANYLCGNQENDPVIEINFPAPELEFQRDAIISLTGADLLPTINDIALPSWKTLLVKSNSVLKFKQPVFGAISYLAVRGGWQADKWLSSYSTHLKLAIGGYHGRTLKKDDHVSFNASGQSLTGNKLIHWQISPHELDKIYQPSNLIRCIQGAEYHLLDDASKTHFERYNFTISHQRDRMGYHLSSEPLFLKQPVDMISSPVDAGTIQLLPSGSCIILAADHQTSGGYPRVGSVIKADLPKLAQAVPGQSINFSLISLKQAEEQLLLMQQTMEEMKAACYLNLKKYTA